MGFVRVSDRAGGGSSYFRLMVLKSVSSTAGVSEGGLPVAAGGVAAVRGGGGLAAILGDGLAATMGGGDLAAAFGGCLAGTRGGGFAAADGGLAATFGGGFAAREGGFAATPGGGLAVAALLGLKRYRAARLVITKGLIL